MHDRFVQPDRDTIRRLRQGHFWSQEQLTDAAGLRKRTVERAEAGARLRRTTPRALAQALRVAADGPSDRGVCPPQPAPGSRPHPGMGSLVAHAAAVYRIDGQANTRRSDRPP